MPLHVALFPINICLQQKPSSAPVDKSADSKQWSWGQEDAKADRISVSSSSLSPKPEDNSKVLRQILMVIQSLVLHLPCQQKWGIRRHVMWSSLNTGGLHGDEGMYVTDFLVLQASVLVTSYLLFFTPLAPHYMSPFPPLHVTLSPHWHLVSPHYISPFPPSHVTLSPTGT